MGKKKRDRYTTNIPAHRRNERNPWGIPVPAASIEPLILCCTRIGHLSRYQQACLIFMGISLFTATVGGINYFNKTDLKLPPQLNSNPGPSANQNTFPNRYFRNDTCTFEEKPISFFSSASPANPIAAFHKAEVLQYAVNHPQKTNKQDEHKKKVN